MFVTLAKFRIHPSRRPAPRVGPFAPANDNRPHLRDSGKGCARRPRLVCRWFAIEGTGRLGCRWEIEGSDGPGNSLGPQAGAALHKTVVEPSYEPGCRWAHDQPGCRRAERPLFAVCCRVARTSLAEAI